MNKPALFVGSSSEGLDLARAVRALLDEDAEVTLWKEGFFDVGGTFIDSLIKALPRFDFAALMLTADDLLTSREVATLGPRDNVLFELGLFMGRLGRERTFVIRARGDQIKIPSDLAGLTTTTYDWPRADGNHQAAVGPACDNIRKMIRTLGFSETRTSTQSHSAGGTGPSRDRPTDNSTILAAELRFRLRARPSRKAGVRRAVFIQEVGYI